MRILFTTFLLSTALLWSGTAVRQSLNWHDRPIVGWSCPACGVRNASDPETAFHATCRRCGAGHDWQRILHPHDPPGEAVALTNHDPF